jgi:hypothetical protein
MEREGGENGSAVGWDERLGFFSFGQSEETVYVCVWVSYTDAF